MLESLGGVILYKTPGSSMACSHSLSFFFLCLLDGFGVPVQRPQQSCQYTVGQNIRGLFILCRTIAQKGFRLGCKIDCHSLNLRGHCTLLGDTN